MSLTKCFKIPKWSFGKGFERDRSPLLSGKLCFRKVIQAQILYNRDYNIVCFIGLWEDWGNLHRMFRRVSSV